MYITTKMKSDEGVIPVNEAEPAGGREVPTAGSLPLALTPLLVGL
jgi:hypothetical protein